MLCEVLGSIIRNTHMFTGMHNYTPRQRYSSYPEAGKSTEKTTRRNLLFWVELHVLLTGRSQWLFMRGLISGTYEAE